MQSTRVLLVDDHPVVRRGLRNLLGVCGVEVVGESGDAPGAVQAAIELEPDVVLMDVQLPGEDGIWATAEIVRRCPRVAVLMLTMFEDVELLMRALHAGARGYVIKSSDEEQL